MPQARRVKLAVAAGLLATAGLGAWRVHAQATAEPTNDAPNPYQTIEGFFKMPEGRTWGSTSAVDIDRDGRSIWVGERCGANACIDRATNQMSPLDPVLKFDATGKLVTSFGKGMIVFPHGIHVDADGNIWVTDGQDNAPQAARGGGGRGAGARGGGAADAAGAGGGAAAGGAAATTDTAGGGGRGGRGGAGGADAAAGGGGGAQAAGGRGAAGPNPAATIGHQVFKFSPQGKLLLTIGRAGGATGPTDCCWQPNDVITNAAGEIFISEGHGTNPNDRIMKFSRDGKFMQAWGTRGAGPVQFNQPHALAFDSQGRLFVGDRGNNRVLIFDRNMNQVADWPQFSRPSGLFIDRNDNLYSADSESGSVSQPRKAWTRGIRVGSIKDGKIAAFIPDPQKDLTSGTLAAEGVAVDAQGNVYGAEVGPRKLQKYVRK